MNFTESFLFTMAITYLGMIESSNKNLTPVQQAAIAQAVLSLDNVIAAFTKTAE